MARASRATRQRRHRGDKIFSLAMLPNTGSPRIIDGMAHYRAGLHRLAHALRFQLRLERATAQQVLPDARRDYGRHRQLRFGAG